MVNTKIKLITFFVVEDEEAVYSQQKQDLEVTVAQIIRSDQISRSVVSDSLRPHGQQSPCP